MWYFLGGIALLILGYFSYGKFLERILAPDDRVTPAIKNADGVDYVPLPHWKNMLIQLLNIAGIGPVIGVILGIKFGEIVFLLIPIGNILAGATHDYLGGMMSLRRNGANLPALIRENLGNKVYYAFSIFVSLLLLLVVAVFINIPANLIDGLDGVANIKHFWIAVIAIFIYYIIATLFPVDKIIGRVYPMFGLMLLLGTFAIFGAIVWNGFKDPSILTETAAFKSKMWTSANNHPVLPLLFVTIACGIISGFHATQSPIIARSMRHEREARSSFYGMMILEGIIAMIWAAAGLAIYNLFPEQMGIVPAKVLGFITTYFLGKWGGAITVIAVIILAITSGDTAMRSLRLSFAEIFKLSQKNFISRILLIIPLIVVVTGLLIWSNSDVKSFNNLWNYFAWSNQVLAACTLFAATVWLRNNKKPWWIAALPAVFMTFIVATYIFWISPAHGGPVGFGLELNMAYYFGGVIALLCLAKIFAEPPKEADKE
ncbi:MAG: carbon starvation protein A [Lentisphaeria bacterium]|nr:carbon starvation protein A [Lentisphaeria bacterium]